ncbi:MAG TPA: class I tRNA ligase family protein, partial [Candidatus Eremiobacteraceae bacterium]|nr:class I tRNA ligase family protein [Candidatus Eremiobacteraceae bacterium]
NGRCPNPECGREVEWVSEDAWFFKLSRYRDILVDHFNTYPDWVRPESAWNEMASLLRGGLEDLCVSRSSVTWGIPIPGESKTIYVWFDAICNYITAAGYPHDMKRFERLWPADVHLVGKEILRFHTVIWPAILIALDLPLPKLVFANGWITMEGQKMSKSVGNVIRPSELIERFSVDGVRYVLFAQAPFGADFSFSEESLLRRYNAELANDLGNLVQRVLSMLARYRQGKVPAPTSGDELNVEFDNAAAAAREALDQIDFRSALMAIWDRVTSLNLYVEQSKPWVLAKTGDDQLLDESLYNLCEGVRWIAAMIYPFMPATGEAVWDALGQTGTPGETWEKTLRWGQLKAGTQTSVPPALFPRVETEAAPA